MGSLFAQTPLNPALLNPADAEAKDKATADPAATAAARAQENERQLALEAERQKALQRFGAPSYGFDHRRGLTSLLGVG